MLWRKNKLLETENELLMTKLKDKEAEIERLNAIISGERVCGNYCSSCVHARRDNKILSYETYECKLNCRCKDYLDKSEQH